MSSCYKCGRELPGMEVECDPACPPEGQSPVPSAPPAGFPEPQQLIRWEEFDWSKVTTVADVVEIIASFGLTVRVGSQVHARLKRFLKS